ncbi:hypothetical protein N6H14_21580 [Paenibacillus sp. CC-CFT747]|nr:hypothetical protein N6H14_21580 [Paenibacillus sp. CC-CFT747]
MAQFGSTGAASFGSMTMSIGVDLGTIQSFNEIRLTDSKEWNAVTEAELSVYVSDTNNGTENSYRPVTGWTFHKEGSLILLDGFHETGRYVKVHGRFAPGARDPLTQSSLQAVMSVHFTPGDPPGKPREFRPQPWDTSTTIPMGPRRWEAGRIRVRRRWITRTGASGLI